MLEEHLGYVADRVRLDAFKVAIVRTVRTGDRVVDLGCGSGVLGLLCLDAGASHVVAIDESAMADIARLSFSQAGYDSNVTVIQDHSARVSIPDPVDVVICDNVGYFGFDYYVLGSLSDARKRFLKPGGRLMPGRLRFYAAAVQASDIYHKASGWRAENIPAMLRWLDRYAINTKYPVTLKRDDVLSEPVLLAEIDLHKDVAEFLSWNATTVVDRAGVVHGLAGWFEAELAPGVWMTNSPLAEAVIDRPQAFLPISEAVAVRAGERMEFSVKARPAEHLLAWTLNFVASAKRFSHSTWNGMPVSREDLQRVHKDRVPKISRYGQARRIVLGYCDGVRTAAEIGQAVLRDYPKLFPSDKAIIQFVDRILARDTE